MTPPIDEDDDLRAAELAFGLLSEADAVAVEAQAARDAGFAERYRWWQARAFALFDARDAIPPATTWPAIARRLPANDDARTVRRWQAATAIAASIAAVLGVTLLLSPEPVPSPPAQVAAPRPFVAVLASADRGDMVAVDYDVANRRLSALPAALSVDHRSAELWVIPAGGAPVSLGLVAAQGRTRRVPAPRVAALLVPGSTLAISLEPRGGSPTGAPTGPVILTGRIARS